MLSGEGLGQTEAAAFELDVAVRADAADLVRGIVVRLGKGLGDTDRAWPVSAGGDIEVAGLMRTGLVIDASPSLQAGLEVGYGGETVGSQHLDVDRALEALVLALDLGMG